jgi:Phosphotransferase enzyme family
MRIGIDFDNTIVSYDSLFHRVARERNLIPHDTPVNKVAIRDHLRQIGKEELWTEMQGYVYGARMDEALAYPGVIEFLSRAAASGDEVAIVSHKTKSPYLGTQYDLHAAARAWVEKHLRKDGIALVPTTQVFFELTKEEKLARIEAFGCDIFIDDLPEILQAKVFPTGTRRVLFDPERNHAGADLRGIWVTHSWNDFQQDLPELRMSVEASASASALLASINLPAAIQSIEICAIGANNRTHKITTAHDVFIAKQYFQHQGDTRDRLAAEFAFLSYSEKAAPGLTPRPLARDSHSSVALYEFINGRPFRAGEITAEHVDIAADFYCALNAPHARSVATLPIASEACFSIREHLELIEGRVNRLLEVEPQDDDHLVRPVFEELSTCWRVIARKVEAHAAGAGLDLSAPLAMAQRCVSPSDFGFHNALRENTGAIRFLDFEYAGWDDPAKMTGDFFAQLAVPVPGNFFERFVEKTMSPFPDSKSLIVRAELLRPVYQIKWCCIALNVFLPVHLARRKFSNPGLDAVALKRAQIAKAKNLLKSLHRLNHGLR